MIDIKIIRTEPDKVRDLCKKRGCKVDVDELIKIDKSLRETETEADQLRHQQKNLQGIENREKSRKLKDKIKKLEETARELKIKRDNLWGMLPNLLSPDVPKGKDDSDNVEISRRGNHPKFDFKPRTHELIGTNLDILDIKRGAKVAGAGFYYWKGDGAKLISAIFNFAREFIGKRKFIEMYTPIVAKEKTLFGTGYLPFSKDQIYKVENEDFSLIGTSEQTLVAYHIDELFPAKNLPLLYSAFTPCLRTEAGSYGKAVRGIFRVHQFHKVEQIVFCRPEDSEEWHKQCLKNEEDFMQALELPYRVVNVCIGDLGAPGYKKYDVEAWFAGFNNYRETHSNTNLLDYQTRRLNIRCKDKGSAFHPHTISATLATDRIALAILENCQQSDGSVLIPEVLQKYMFGMTSIKVKK